MIKPTIKVCFCIAILLIFLLTVCGNTTPDPEIEQPPEHVSELTPVPPPIETTDLDWIFELDGKRIPTVDLQFYMAALGVDPSDLNSRQTALGQLIEAQIIINRAARHGVGLNTDEVAAYLPHMQNMLQFLGLEGIVSDERAVDFFTVDVLVERLIDQYVPIDSLDHSEFAQELTEYIENNRRFLDLINVKYILTADGQGLSEQLQNGITDFDELIREFSISQTAENTVSLLDVMYGFDLDEHRGFPLFELEPGEMSDIIDLGGIFLLIYIHERAPGDPAEIKNTLTEHFLFSRRMEVLTELMISWKYSTEYIINQQAFDSLGGEF